MEIWEWDVTDLWIILASPSNRMSLTESGLFPQQYTADEMIGHNV